jgi:hypothetical protein
MELQAQLRHGRLRMPANRTKDGATITITGTHGTVVLTVSGLLDKGNQQAQTDNK